MIFSDADRRWVAFLRAINTGNRRVTGDRLVACFESLGFTGVSTFLASGNVLFDGHEPEASSIERVLSRDLGYEVPAVLRTGAAIRELASVMPFTEGEFDATEQQVQVMLLRTPRGRDVIESAIEGVPAPDLLRIQGQDVFWLPRNGVSTSDVDVADLERRLGPITVRTLNTMVRLAARL